MKENAFIDIIVDGSPESGRFGKVEYPLDQSRRSREWLQRDDGWWVLRIYLNNASPKRDEIPRPSHQPVWSPTREMKI